jgi:hypothetical protein
MGYHALTCTGTCNFNHQRHQTVRDGLFDLAMVAGGKPIKDPLIACTRESGAVVRPTDLLVLGNNHPTMCIDTTIVSPFVVAATRPLQVGKSVKNAEIKKYKKIAEPCELSSYDFMAFASDVLAVVPVTSYSFIQHLAKAYSATSGKSYSD